MTIRFHNNMIRKTAVVATGVLIASGALADTKDDWAATVAAAEKEGKVIVYSVLIPSTMDATIAAFSKAYPKIQLQISRNIDSAIALKVRQEQQVNAEGADALIHSSYDPIDQQANAGMLVTPAGPNAAVFGPLYRDVVPVLSAMPVAIAYNTDLVSRPIEGYADLLSPEFKGTVGVMSIDAGAAPLTWYDYIRNRYPDFWEKLAAQEPVFHASSVPLVQGVASGETALGGWGLPMIANPLIEKGAPLKLAVDKTETFGIHFVGGVLKNAHHPNAAQVFMDFMMSREGQEVLNGDGKGISVLPDIPGAMEPVKMVTADPKIYTPEKLKSIADDWNKVFKK